MSPVSRAGSVIGMNFALGSHEKFQLGSRDEKRSKILGTSFGAKFGKQSKHGETQFFFTFRPSVTLKAVSLQLNGMLMMCKIHQAMQDDAIRTTRIHPAVHLGSRDKVFIWQNFQPAYQASPPSHMNTSKILQRI